MNKEDWFVVKGITKYRGETCHLVTAELLVKALTMEDACAKARKFLEPVADFEPMSCKYNGE